MGRAVIICILFAISLTGLPQNNHVPCGNFKKGHFSYRDTGANLIWEIRRTAKTHTELKKETGVHTKFRIEWLTECEYKLTQFYSNKMEKRAGNGSWQVYRIISGSENSYTWECKCDDASVLRGLVVKMW